MTEATALERIMRSRAVCFRLSARVRRCVSAADERYGVFGRVMDLLLSSVDRMTTATDLLHDPPPVLYVPTIRADDGEEHIALRRMADGRTALLVYTALDRLRDCVGPDSAWVLVDWRGLESVQQQSPFDVILPDLVVPDQYRHDGGWL